MAEPIVLITGLPRSGTSLTTELLGGLPDCLSLDEPIDIPHFTEGARMEPGRMRRRASRLLRRPIPKAGLDRRRIIDNVMRFCEAQRVSALERGVVHSQNVGGSVLGQRVADEFEPSGARKSLAKRGDITIEKSLSRQFRLFVKHNSGFAALLPDLAKRAPVFAILRNPLAILASWNTVPFPVSRGHATLAEMIEPELSHALSRLPDVHDRQLHLLGWFFERFLQSIPESRIVRYEDIVESNGSALAVVDPSAAGIRAELASRNRAGVYQDATVRAMGERLLDADGAYWRFYDRRDVLGLIPGASGG